MAGLLAWAADVVGGGDATSDEDNQRSASELVAFTPEQQRCADELDRAAASLRRSIQDLRLRIPPDDLSQRLPHLHADSVASNAALALQLNAHTTTKEHVILYFPVLFLYFLFLSITVHCNNLVISFLPCMMGHSTQAKFYLRCPELINY
jgi:hypothetical protein